MLSVGELRRMVAGLPDDAAVEVVVRTGDGGVLSMSVSPGAGTWGPNCLGFSGVRVEAVVEWHDLVTSKALTEVPAWILRRVLDTGGVPTVWEMEEEGVDW